jgi:4-hydroxy-tetrahydrodipicolinate synthase
MSLERIRAALRGVSGVHVTAYGPDGDIDGATTARVVERIAAAGVHNIVSAGNTGEYYTLDSAEIGRVHALAAEAARGRALVTAGVGRSLREAIAQAKAAAASGCDAVMAHHPLDPFAAPQSQAAYVRALADASPVPVVAYLRSDAIPLGELGAIARHGNVAGIKYATPNLMQLAEAIRATEGASAIWVCGLAEGWAAPFRAVGARGFTSGLVNVAPERSHRALEADDGETARRLVSEIAGFEALRTRFSNGANVTVVKEAMRLTGWPVGAVRLPGLPELDAADRATLSTILAAWGHATSARAAA